MSAFFTCVVVALAWGGGLPAGPRQGPPDAARGKKVLYVNAYHPGYAWSDSEQRAAEKVLSKAGVDCRVFYMETKTKSSPAEIGASAQAVRKMIETFRPDVVILADDNPVQHILVPWYRTSAIPFVFCGVNWECRSYGLPVRNVTGMLEISLVPQMLDAVRPLNRGRRIAMLGNANETDRKEGRMIRSKFNIAWTMEKYVTTFDEWKAAYAALQDDADIVFWCGWAGIKGWKDAEAADFVMAHTRAITCSTQYYMKDLVLVGYMKLGEEQGDWAARTALEIMNGVSPARIPVAQNAAAKVTLNMKLAKRMNIVFPIRLLKHAELVR